RAFDVELLRCDGAGNSRMSAGGDTRATERPGKRSWLSSAVLQIAILTCSMPGNSKGPQRNSSRSRMPLRYPAPTVPLPPEGIARPCKGILERADKLEPSHQNH